MLWLGNPMQTPLSEHHGDCLQTQLLMVGESWLTHHGAQLSEFTTGFSSIALDK